MSKKLVVVATQASAKEIFLYEQHTGWRPLFWCLVCFSTLDASARSKPTLDLDLDLCEVIASYRIPSQ